MLFSLIELSRIVFPSISVTVCLSLILLLQKQTILKQKKSAKKIKYKNRQKPKSLIYFLYSTSLFVCNFSNSIISQNKTSKKKKNVLAISKTHFFLNNRLGHTKFNTGKFFKMSVFLLCPSKHSVTKV